MIIFKIDGKEWTKHVQAHGHAATLAMQAQLTEITGRMLGGLSTGLVYQGEPQGDSIMLGAPREYALEVLHRAMRLRDEPPWQHPNWLPLRMVVGLANVAWPSTPFKLGTGPQGFDLNVIARLLAEPPDGACPPGSLVINAALLAAVREYNNNLIDLFSQQTIVLEGVGEVEYGILPPLHYPRSVVLWRSFLRGRLSPLVAALLVQAVGALAWWLSR